MAHGRRRDALVEQTWSLNNQIEATLFGSNDLPKALALGQESLRLLAASREPSAEAVAHSLLSLVHDRSGERKSALESADQAASILAEFQPTSFGMLVAYTSTASTFLLKTDMFHASWPSCTCIPARSGRCGRVTRGCTRGR